MAKKLHTILVIVTLAVFSGIAFTSCGDDDDEPKPDKQEKLNLIGTKYEGALDDELYTLEFNTKDACRLTHIDDERRKPNDPPHMVTNYYYYTYSIENVKNEIRDEDGNISGIKECIEIRFMDEKGEVIRKAVLGNDYSYMNFYYRGAYETFDLRLRLYKVLY